MPRLKPPPTPAEQQAAFDRARDQLKEYVGQMLWLIDDTFPPGYPWPNPDPRVTGAAWEYPMHTLKDGIDNILASFDSLQVCMGEEYPRHERFLTGKCNG